MVSCKEIQGGKYYITDVAGITLQTGVFNMQHGAVQISLNATLINGDYFITVVDNSESKVSRSNLLLLSKLQDCLFIVSAKAQQCWAFCASPTQILTVLV